MRIALPLATGVVAIAALILAVVALAGDGGAKSEGSDFDDRLLEMQASLTSVQLVAALDALDGLGIHHHDEATTKAISVDDVPSGEYLADVRKIRRIVGAVSWPEELQDEVSEILQRGDEIEEVLEGDDLAAMKAASPTFHLAWHTLREVGYQALSGQAASEAEQHGEEEGE